MKKFNPHQSISLTFSDDAKPESPLRLGKEVMVKLGQIPRLCNALLEAYGAKLGEPTLWGGAVHMEIQKDADLFDVASDMVTHLALSAQQVHENAQRQPPLLLARAVTHAHCIGLLHVLTKVYEQSELVAALHSGSDVFELPQLALSDFTEPSPPEDTGKRINLDVIGLCIPRQDANVVVLANLTTIELPHDSYSYNVAELQQMIFGSSTRFVGWATAVQKGVSRAMPGGDLLAQHRL